MILVIMGVSGSGKTTVGERLARRLGAGFLEGDRFHPPGNIAKMERGIPLDDTDRLPWLERLAAELAREQAAGRSAVLACSALKRPYRDLLERGCPGLRFVYLAGDKALIRERLDRRHGHFMPPELLDSQFAALEPPLPGEPAISVDVGGDPEAIVDDILRRLAAAEAP